MKLHAEKRPQRIIRVRKHDHINYLYYKAPKYQCATTTVIKGTILTARIEIIAI